jgi:hypothetical protein
MNVIQQQFGYVKIDGETTPLLTFSTPSASLVYRGDDDPDRGKYNRGVSKADIVVNSSEKVKNFTTVNVPGASWAARYRNPLFGTDKYLFINFEQPSDTQEDSLESESEQISEPVSAYGSESGEISQYGSENEEEENEPVHRGNVHEDVPLWTVVEVETNETIDPDTRPDFSLLTDKERFLPLSYVLSRVDQWDAILKCLSSEFTIVADLPKVSTSILSEAADYCAYADARNLLKTNSAYALITYAQQRERIE